MVIISRNRSWSVSTAPFTRATGLPVTCMLATEPVGAGALEAGAFKAGACDATCANISTGDRATPSPAARNENFMIPPIRNTCDCQCTKLTLTGQNGNFRYVCMLLQTGWLVCG